MASSPEKSYRRSKRAALTRDERDMLYPDRQHTITPQVHFHPTSRLARFSVSLLMALCFFLLFLAAKLQAQTELTTADLVARVQDHYDRTHSLSADFVQETRSQTARLGSSAKGKLYFLKPRAIRWDYEEPLQQFVVNDEKAWLYVPDEKTIYLYEVEHIISSPIVLSFFSGLGQLGEVFNISKLPIDPGPPARYRLQLLPRESESPVSRVTLWVSAESYYVVRIKTEDPLGNINEISFSNIQVDLPLEPSWFALEVPEGVRMEQQEASPSG